MKRRAEQKNPSLGFVFCLFVSGAYVSQKHSLTSMESLEKVQNGLTETTNRIYNYLTSLKFFDYGLVAKYLTNMKNLSLASLPSMNVSVPSLKDIGWKLTW